jgi:hypothetical protein
MQAPHCSVEECPNPPLAHGLCTMHTKISFEHHHPMVGPHKGTYVTMAGQFFHSLSKNQPLGVGKLKVVLPVVRVPFIRREQDGEPGEPAFQYFNYRGKRDDRGNPIDEIGNPVLSFIRDVKKPKSRLTLREELVEGIQEPNVLERPIVFLVATNIPHTGIYILYGGQFYSVAFGYDTTPATGSLYSIDIPLIQFSEARIVWVGILTDAMVERLQAEFDRVTHIVGNFEPADVAGGPLIVDRLMLFHTPRAYGGVDADSNPDEWNCTKWAMHILFGDGMPANFRDLVSRTNPGLTKDQLTRWLTAYEGRDQAAFLRVLHDINDASFPRVSRGGRRRRMTKRKIRKLRKTRKN